MKGICPVCTEEKEITEQGKVNGQCDDCYKQKYTCAECGEMVTDAWDMWYIPGKGNGHRKCLDATYEAAE